MHSKQIQFSEQIYKFVQQLAPQPKKRIRKALRDLTNLNGDIKELEAPLQNYCRLRVAQFRIIFKIKNDNVRCIFIERRSTLRHRTGE